MSHLFFFKKTHTPVVYIHVPKCGGTSISHAIRDSQPKSLFGKSRNFQLKPVKTKRDADAAGKDLFEHREEIFIKELKSKKHDFLTGHTRCVPEVKNEFDHSYHFVTLLRDPVERWFSNYFYNLHKEDDHFKTNLSLSDYLEAEKLNPINFNIYTTYFSSPSISAKNHALRVKSACENLATFKVIGILEDLTSFKESFKKELSRDLFIKVSNANKVVNKEDRNQQIPDNIRDEVTKLCQHDMKVYEFAKSSTT